MKLLIGTTLVPWKCERNEHLDWLNDRKNIINKHKDSKFFASLEVDSRGIQPFMDVLRMLGEVGGEYWTYQINDHIKTVGSQNRWIRMETGRNLIREFAQRNTWLQNKEDADKPAYVEYDSILYIDSDINLTLPMVDQMLDCDADIVSFNFPHYGGSSVAGMMIKAPLYFDLPFYHNSFEKINDDHKFQQEIKKKFGKIKIINNIKIDTPESMTPVEDRQIPDRML